ncbi:MAG: hypothetical protein HDS75_08730 [Bacteroidales bacterium]|nr:hypothetical protein [Bacteroidales bacterium]
MIEHVINGCPDSILVMGSSVALNSIDTQTLSDSLATTAYNAGVNGQRLPFVLTLLKGMEAHKQMPARIMLGLHGSDFYSDGNGSRYNILAPYYNQGNSYLDSLLRSRRAIEPLLLKSNLYRYNTSWLRILLYELLQMKPDNPTGFVAKPVPPIFPTREDMSQSFDSIHINRERLDQIRDIMDICASHGTALTIIFTPLYSFSYQTAIDSVSAIANRYPSTDIWNDTQLRPFVSDSTLFYDPVHLNVNGAKIYTDTIISRLKMSSDK